MAAERQQTFGLRNLIDGVLDLNEPIAIAQDLALIEGLGHNIRNGLVIEVVL